MPVSTANPAPLIAGSEPPKGQSLKTLSPLPHSNMAIDLRMRAMASALSVFG